MERYRFILSIILLFSAIVIIINNLRPHHHHYHQVCFISNHCDDHDDEPDHDGFDHSHDYPFNEQCKVNTHYIIPFVQKINGKLICDSQKKEIYDIEILKCNNQNPSINATFRHIVFAEKQTGQNLKILIRALRAPPGC